MLRRFGQSKTPVGDLPYLNSYDKDGGLVSSNAIRKRHWTCVTRVPLAQRCWCTLVWMRLRQRVRVCAVVCGKLPNLNNQGTGGLLVCEWLLQNSTR